VDDCAEIDQGPQRRRRRDRADVAPIDRFDAGAAVHDEARSADTRRRRHEDVDDRQSLEVRTSVEPVKRGRGAVRRQRSRTAREACGEHALFGRHGRRTDTEHAARLGDEQPVSHPRSQREVRRVQSMRTLPADQSE
jgi:hypothetical protein